MGGTVKARQLKDIICIRPEPVGTIGTTKNPISRVNVNVKNSPPPLMNENRKNRVNQITFLQSLIS
jgi:hypothetical protein